MITHTIHNEASLANAVRVISGLSLKKPWLLTLGRPKDRRSLSQNALYWSWVADIAKATTNSPKATHEALKAEFCPATEVRIGPLTKMTQTTAELEVAAMTEYMNHVRAFAETELGVFLTVPEDQHRR